jgi:hypothetical protein
MRKHYRTDVNEHSIRADVVEMVVRIDHKSHRQLCQCANRREELFSRLSSELTIGIDACGRVDDGDAIIADDEPRIRPGGCFDWIGNRGPDVRGDLLQRTRSATSGCWSRTMRKEGCTAGRRRSFTARLAPVPSCGSFAAG